MSVYKIRAHHGMCLSFFQGKGYSGDFVENMARMKAILAENPEIILRQYRTEKSAIYRQV